MSRTNWEELDVASEASVEAAIAAIVAATGQIDVVVHNAGHLVYGPAESFTPSTISGLVSSRARPRADAA